MLDIFISALYNWIMYHYAYNGVMPLNGKILRKKILVKIRFFGGNTPLAFLYIYIITQTAEKVKHKNTIF